MEETSKYGVLGRHQPCSEERIEILSNTIERYHSLRNTPILFYPESFSDGNWRDIYQKVFASPRLPPKISLERGWMKALGSEIARQPEGEVVQQSKSTQSSHPNPNPDRDRTVKTVVCPQRGARGSSRSQKIETCSFREEAVKHDRTEKPVVCCDEIHEQPTVVCYVQTTHPRLSREGQTLILEEETNHDRTWKPIVCRDANHEQSKLNEVDITSEYPDCHILL